MIGRGERFVRSVYRVVIALASIYFYISMPLVILLAVGFAAGMIYLLLAVGTIPIQVGAALVGLAFYTLVAAGRAILVRHSDEEPGRLLGREEAPALWALVEAVAERVGTAPVDAIYIAPGTGVSVTERGSLLQTLRGEGERCLIIGLGVLPGMTQTWFEAILGHEYGHFAAGDTAGGQLAGRVQVAMHRMAHTLAVHGQAYWYNPAWLFVTGYNRIFLRITLGASRLQEILADRYAAMAFGARHLVDGLTHIVRQSIAFDAIIGHKVDLCTHVGMQLSNLYVIESLPDHVRVRADARMDEEMSRRTRKYDSHPSPAERIQLLRQMEGTGEEQGSTQPVWDLLPQPQALQEEMMTIIRADVQRWRHACAVRAAQRRWRDNRHR